jgi:hypothetical protein
MWITSFPSAPGWIVHALDALPDRVDKKTKARAGAHLVATFSPRSLRILGRRVLDVVAPRSPRTTNTAGRRPRTRTPRGPPGGPTTQRLGHAFGAFLEAVDPTRLPLHGGDATTIIVTTGYQTLRDGLGTAYLGDQPIGPGHSAGWPAPPTSCPPCSAPTPRSSSSATTTTTAPTTGLPNGDLRFHRKT